MNRQSHDSEIADYIDLIFDSFLELRGDRKSGDDRTVAGGLARLNGYKVVFIGYQRDTRPPGPEGYRKCLRLIRLAEAFNKPVIVFINIPVAVPLPALEQQRVDEAIARNLEEMSCLMTPIISVIIGESNEIAAVDMCVADRVLMLEGASCSVPLVGGVSANGVDTASLCLKAQDLLELNIIHRMVKGASKTDLECAANELKEAILEELRRLTQIRAEALVQQRLDRLQHQFLDFGTSGHPSGSTDDVV
jgi:acetyl-CoA carboxylase carboxyl transferase subunit alpha